MNRKYIAILRGINVSGQKKISMEVLRSLFESLDFTNVSTYIQSGNVIFCSENKTKNELKAIIENQIEKTLKINVPVHIIDEAFLKRVIDDNPFNTSDTDHSKLYFCFLYSSPKPDLKAKLRDTIFENEKFFMTDNIVYLYFPMGFGKAKMNNNFIENKLKVTASTRNWRTTQKLFHLLKEVKCE